ncbi:MAG: hypothetical protein QM539_00925, partial [Alphaproteobacteria bacterium]|nr:hypothetical protein [Alphaproteobacteria bacterium]
MKRKLLFILPLIILSFGYFNLKCIPNVAKMPYYFQLGFDSNVTTWNILLLNEYGKFVDFSKITDGLLRPLSFVNLYGDPPEFDKTKLNHTVLVKYTI